VGLRTALVPGGNLIHASSVPDPNRWKALAVLGVAYLMVVLDVSVVNVALPSIQTDLGFSESGLQWVISGYALTFGGLLLLGGRSGDLLGRRKIFMVGLALFSLFSLLCGLATSSGMLIAMRALQGAAGAILSPSVFSITSVTFPEGSERNKALGILGAIAGSGAAIGVLLGGVLTEYVGWEWIFFINVPIGVATLFVVPLVVHESRATDMERHFDAAGAVTVTAGLMLFVYALTRAPTVGWGSAETIGAFLGWAILTAAFVVIELRSRSPLVPLSIFRRRTLTGANVIGFILGTMIFGMFFLLSLYMQQVLGFTALETGVNYLAVALTAVVASGVAQALVTRAGVKPVLTAGMLLLAGGLAYFTQISVDGSYFADLFPGFLLIGVGLGFSFVPVSIAALAGVTGKEAGLASGLINTNQQVGGALGLAILTTISTTRTSNLVEGGVAKTSALTSGFQLAFWVGVGFALLGLATTLIALKRDDLRLEAQAAGAPIG
jgi:EmrB/QacA subfamily drug resistance transporter